MTQKIRLAMAGALVLTAVPAFGYQEAFSGTTEEAGATVVIHSGDYSDLYAPAPSASEHRQQEPAVAGAYTESFFDPAPARGALVLAGRAEVGHDDARMVPSE